MPDFSRRTLIPELMDAEDVDFSDYVACLRDLRTVNRWTFAYRPTLSYLTRFVASGRSPNDRPIVILDVGCGYGDMLRRIDRWAARGGLAVELIGLDRDPRASRAAREATLVDRPIKWITGDCFSYRPTGSLDLIVSSLFGHHLDDGELVRFLAWMESAAALGWFVNDLHRHVVAYYGFSALARIAGWHRFVRHDGPVSIARAFVADDWRRYLAAAGIPIDAVAIEWRMPFRLCVERAKAL
jgi:SAM-dependent methyltransferase